MVILVKSKISFEKIQLRNAKYIEQLYLVIERQQLNENKATLVTVIYRSPTKSFGEFFAELNFFTIDLPFSNRCIFGVVNKEILSKSSTDFKYE